MIHMGFGRIRDEELIMFTEQFPMCFGAGLSIVETLELFLDETRSRSFRKIVKGVLEDIKKGAGLSDSFKKYNRVFSPIYVGFILAGEETGNLDRAFEMIVKYLEGRFEIRRKIRGFLNRIGFVAIVIPGVILLLVKIIFPESIAINLQKGIALQILAQVLLQISNFLITIWKFLLIVVMSFLVVYSACYSTKKGKLIIDRYKLVIPVFGRISKLSLLSRFLRAFALFFRAGGYPLDKGIVVASNVISNIYIRNELAIVQESLKQGYSIAEALKQRKFFPKIMVQAFTIGEATGSDRPLDKLADYWDKEIDYVNATLWNFLCETLSFIFH